MARILVVEDNAANMKLALLLLGNAGHEVLCALDARNHFPASITGAHRTSPT